MTKREQEELITQTYKLALDGKHITVPYLQNELEIEDENIARTVIEVLVKHGKIIYVDLDGDRFWMDVNKLKVNYGMPNHPEKDEKLIELITLAKKGEAPVYTATVDIKKIKPFCEYRPKKENFEKTRDQLKRNIEKNAPPLLHVYQNGEHLVMSDDYYAYFTYLEEGFSWVPCIIFGEIDIEGIRDKKKIKYN